MQNCLMDLYGLDLGYDINDFLITDQVLAGALGGTRRCLDEELLIAEHEGEAAVSLYLHEDLLKRLEDKDPTTLLNHENLADFWTAFEGVSHFTYFVFKASSDQCVTLLEMELQAEVDKFVVTTLLLRQQGEIPPSNLHQCLFDLPKLDSRLSPIEYERYERANHYAGRYCRRLWPALRRANWAEDVQRELRRFYRLPRPEKIGHIQASS